MSKNKKKPEFSIEDRVEGLELTVLDMSEKLKDIGYTVKEIAYEINKPTLTPVPEPVPCICTTINAGPNSRGIINSYNNKQAKEISAPSCIHPAYKPMKDDSTEVKVLDIDQELDRIKRVNKQYIEQTLDTLFSEGHGATVYDDKVITPHCFNEDLGGIMVAAAINDKCNASISTIMNTSNLGFRHVHTEKVYEDPDEEPIIRIIDDGPITTPIVMGGTRQENPTAMIVPLNNLEAIDAAVNMLVNRFVGCTDNYNYPNLIAEKYK